METIKKQNCILILAITNGVFLWAYYNIAFLKLSILGLGAVIYIHTNLLSPASEMGTSSCPCYSTFQTMVLLMSWKSNGGWPMSLTPALRWDTQKMLLASNFSAIASLIGEGNGGVTCNSGWKISLLCLALSLCNSDLQVKVNL